MFFLTGWEHQGAISILEVSYIFMMVRITQVYVFVKFHQGATEVSYILLYIIVCPYRSKNLRVFKNYCHTFSLIPYTHQRKSQTVLPTSMLYGISINLPNSLGKRY